MGLASAGLVVAELGNLFTFRAQPKKRDVTVLVEEVFSREKKKHGRTISTPQTQNSKNDET